MFLLGIGSGRSKGSILNHIFRGVTALILTSAVAHASDLNKDLLDAAGKGNERKVLALLQKGADVNAADDLGWTPLKRAAENNKVDVVDLLIENGAMIDTLNGSPIPSYAGIAASGYTAIHRAAWDGRTEAVKVLIEHGAALDLTTDETADEGYTALHLAVAGGRIETVKVLMEHGAALDLHTAGGGGRR